MKVQGKRRTRLARGASGDYAFECLSRVARILVRCGHSPRDLLSHFRDISRTLGEPSLRWDPERLNFIADLPHVIALWYSDPAYLQARGTPAALPMLGRGATLSALIRRVLPEQDPGTVARTLLDLKAIHARGGRYVPTGRVVGFRRDTARLYSLSQLLRILRTIERNITGTKATAITERHAIHPRFPVAALPGFHSRLKTRASEFLWDTDNDMRRRERRYRRGRMTRLGVEIFAFEEPLTQRRKRRRSAADRPGKRSRSGSSRGRKA